VDDIVTRLRQWSLVTFTRPALHDLPSELTEAADDIERLRAAIDAFLADVDSDHQPEWMDQGAQACGLEPIWCRKCGAVDGNWPCTDRMALDQLKEARRG
jgi:hypothetical protein